MAGHEFEPRVCKHKKGLFIVCLSTGLYVSPHARKGLHVREGVEGHDIPCELKA